MEFPLWSMIISNAVVATLLAMAALAVRRMLDNPRLEHFIWLLVLVKLFTPAIFDVPVALPSAKTATVTTHTHADLATPISATLIATHSAPSAFTADNVALAIWLLGSCFAGACVARRSRQFARVLANARSMPPLLASDVRGLCDELGIRKVPRVLLIDARLSPLLCWHKGRPTVVIPAQLVNSLMPDALRAILAHELAHLLRRDHYVRVLETIALTCFWWHPVTWLARHRLRESGELCCDEHVLRRMSTAPRTYAAALLRTMDWLSGGDARPMWAATFATGSFRSMTRRFQMLKRTHSRSRIAGLLSAGFAIALTACLSLGVAAGQDDQTKNSDQSEAGQKIWTLSFKITETDPAGEETVIASPKLRTTSTAELRTDNQERMIQIHAKPVPKTSPQQWKVDFQLKQKGDVIASPSIMIIKDGYASFGRTDGSKLTFHVSVE